MSGRPAPGGILETDEDLFRRLEQLNEIGSALSQERNIDHLLEKILLAAKAITRAAGGTLYVLEPSDEGPRLRFAIMRNETLDIAMGGTTGNPIPFYPVHLYGKDGKPNNQMVAAYAALTGKTVNIADAYSEEGFDFSGTRNFDKKTGYRSKAFLTVPMKNHEGENIGVLQLINCKDPATNEIGPFSHSDQRLAESLASQASIALTNRRLINQLEELNDQLKKLFESLIALINTAIDEKSPYTGGHCQRVPALTMMLAEAVNETHEGPLRDFRMTDKDRYELKIAGLLHDCGKVTTPVHVVDKATKLETIFDRINLVETRFEVLKRDLEIEALKRKLELPGGTPEGAAASEQAARIDRDLGDAVRKLEDDREFLRHANIGGEVMSTETQERVKQIGTSRSWTDVSGKRVDFLTPDEIKNLTIARGTLTQEERQTINHHIVATIKMLEALPWPTHLRNVPEYAGGHHERMDGKGYPRGLTREQMSVQARVMGIADIFEALTAKDRPYKRGKTLSESLKILGNFRQNGHVDPDLFDVFVRRKVYLRYAQQFLDREQIDEVDESQIPGFVP
jgi:HD-GYP domain-containing protein (c-di-GMP phosphodiesterase class II)